MLRSAAHHSQAIERSGHITVHASVLHAVQKLFGDPWGADAQGDEARPPLFVESSDRIGFLGCTAYSCLRGELVRTHRNPPLSKRVYM